MNELHPPADWTPILPVMPGQEIMLHETDLEDNTAEADYMVSLDGREWVFDCPWK